MDLSPGGTGEDHHIKTTDVHRIKNMMPLRSFMKL